MSLYTEAASVLHKFENKQGTIKSLVFGTHFGNVRKLYALVCESLKYQTALQTIFRRCEGLQKEEILHSDPYLGTVLLYEYLLGKGLGYAGRIRNCILKHKREVRDECDKLLKEQGTDSLASLLSIRDQAFNSLPIPRYARVNLLKISVDETVAVFEAEGWSWHGYLCLNSFRSEVVNLGHKSFARDPLLQDVLIFPPSTDLHDHHLTISGHIILQDRASCFPAHVLNPLPGSTVLDCCAAPGNKTSHVASLLNNSGKIIAYERDAKRFLLLQEQLKKMGVTNTTTVCQDFLSVDPNDPLLADVKYILVDPSCSGSGIISRFDPKTSDASSSVALLKRLHNLARFQISILKHALKLPAVLCVVYSTCSIHTEENEAVIEEVARQVSSKFCVKKIFPEWNHRGCGNSQFADLCLRMTPEQDLSHGFFIACFQRCEFEKAENAGDREESGYPQNESLKQVRKRKPYKLIKQYKIDSRNLTSESHSDNHSSHSPTTFESLKNNQKKSKIKKRKQSSTNEEATSLKKANTLKIVSDAKCEIVSPKRKLKCSTVQRCERGVSIIEMNKVDTEVYHMDTGASLTIKKKRKEKKQIVREKRNC